MKRHATLALACSAALLGACASTPSPTATPSVRADEVGEYRAGSGLLKGYLAAGEAPDSLAETPAPELPRAFRAKAEQQRRMRRAAAQGVAWAALAVALLALIAAAFVFRLQIVQAWPQAAAVYKLAGAPVNLAGLDFEAVGAKTAAHDPNKIVVSGALRNIRDNEVVAPPVRVALLDAAGAAAAGSACGFSSTSR